MNEQKRMNEHLTIELRDITPAWAELALRGDAANYRSVRDRRVAVLVGVMKRGEWTLNGSTITFSDESGRVLHDGQHRLKAVVRSGCTIKSLVVYGVRDPFRTTDTGQPRNLNDALKQVRATNVNATGSALRLLWTFDQGKPLDSKVNRPPTISQLMDTYDDHPDLAGAVKRVVGMSPTYRFSPMAVVLYVAGKMDATMADRFHLLLSRGAVSMNDSTSSIALLRARMEKDHASVAKLSRMDKLALCIKSWNAFARGRILKNLKFSPGKETYPVIEDTAV